MYGTLNDPVLRTGFGLEAVDDGWMRARSAKYPAVEADMARAMVSMAMTALKVVVLVMLSVFSWRRLMGVSVNSCIEWSFRIV